MHPHLPGLISPPIGDLAPRVVEFLAPPLYACLKKVTSNAERKRRSTQINKNHFYLHKLGRGF